MFSKIKRRCNLLTLSILLAIPLSPFAGPFVQKGLYVCFDGRSLSRMATGYVWDARRGCFKSHLPCQIYQAHHYGHFANSGSQELAFRTCRMDYPFHLGEMQTH